MEVKFKQKVTNYKYLVMFDLASKITGVCIYDIKNQKPLQTQVIKVAGHLELSAAELKQQIATFFLNLENSGISKEEILVSKERMPTQIHGGASTIQTFVALARSHAILDVFLYENNYNTYDYLGVSPSTTHAYYKRLCGNKDIKITKEMIRDYLCAQFPECHNLTLDESDAVFLAKTLLEVKWDSDIQEEIRAQKRHKKTLKVNAAIEKVDQQIDFLNSLKINK